MLQNVVLRVAAVVVLVLGALLVAQAQNDYSYVYIEGDKETPFYVKMEGKMMPRLSQHYCILNNLDAGVTNIEILFQQNKYKPVKFAVQVPKGAARGLMLRRVEDNFALYDLQTGQYILGGNKPEDDDISSLENLIARKYRISQQTSTAKANNVVKAEIKSEEQNVKLKKADLKEELPAFNPDADKARVVKNDKIKVERKKDTDRDGGLGGIFKPKEESVTDTDTKRSSSKYIDNVVINDDDDSDADNENFDSVLPPNTDCSEPMSEELFEAFMKKLKSRDGENRIKYISRNKKVCFSTEQVSVIGRSIGSVSGRMQVLEQLYAQTTDQQNFHMLEHLFRTAYLKDKFKEIINNPKQ